MMLSCCPFGYVLFYLSMAYYKPKRKARYLEYSIKGGVMPHSKQKKEILEKANYRYHFTREIYFNRDAKKVFSLEAIEDNDPQWLLERINMVKTSDKWDFFFNEDPSDNIKREILKELRAC